MQRNSAIVITIAVILLWYTSNIGLLLLNKHLLTYYGFHYPIFLTLCPMTSISILSYVAVVWLKIVPVQRIRSKEQFLKIAALSLIFCGNVVAGNVSLRFLAVSFNQAVGSTTPFFTAVFASLLTVEKEGFLTYLALLPVVAGVIIATGVLGNAKGAVAVVLSILIFRNPVSVSGMLGYTLTVIGVLLQCH